MFEMKYMTTEVSNIMLQADYTAMKAETEDLAHSWWFVEAINSHFYPPLVT